jgi:hypothetical protein
VSRPDRSLNLADNVCPICAMTSDPDNSSVLYEHPDVLLCPKFAEDTVCNPHGTLDVNLTIVNGGPIPRRRLLLHPNEVIRLGRQGKHEPLQSPPSKTTLGLFVNPILSRQHAQLENVGGKVVPVSGLLMGSCTLQIWGRRMGRV